MTFGSATYPGYRFPAEIISHAVWLYHTFGLSLRDVELILAERGITVATRPSDNGASRSAPTSPARCAGANRSRATPGTWTRC
jgi:putative transposase